MDEREKEFDDMMMRCLSGKATKEESDLIDKWLEARAKDSRFDRFPISEKSKIRDEIFQRLCLEIRGGTQGHSKVNTRARKMVFWRAAAAILLLGVLSFSLLKITSSPPAAKKITMVHSVSSTSPTKKIMLSDSTIIWLKGNSSILYPEEFTGEERRVELTGEALFEVAKDPQHPFIIQCGNLTAKVLGTSFNIKSTKTETEVLVLTGKVTVSSSSNMNGLIVLPREKVVYHEAEDKMDKVTAEQKEITEKIVQTDYNMRFLATGMKEIIRRIERKFDVTISISDPRLNNCTITADFTDQSLDRTLSMICQTLKIKYERENAHITLKGVGCG